MASSVLPQVIEMVVRGMMNKSKEEKPKEEKKEEPKPEPEKKRSGGTIGSASKRADGVAIKGKTRGRML